MMKDFSTTSPCALSIPSPRATEMEEMFKHVDTNGDGKISPVELQSYMRSTVGEEVSNEDVEAVIVSADTDGDGLLGLEEFSELVAAEEEGEEERRKNVEDAFKMYAGDGEVAITPKSLQAMLERLGEPRTVEECAAMIRWFDVNKDGVLSFEEFKLMVM